MFGRGTITLGIGPHSSLTAVFHVSLDQPVPLSFSCWRSVREPLEISDRVFTGWLQRVCCLLTKCDHLPNIFSDFCHIIQSVVWMQCR